MEFNSTLGSHVIKIAAELQVPDDAQSGAGTPCSVVSDPLHDSLSSFEVESEKGGKASAASGDGAEEAGETAFPSSFEGADKAQTCGRMKEMKETGSLYSYSTASSSPGEELDGSAAQPKVKMQQIDSTAASGYPVRIPRMISWFACVFVMII